MSEPTPSTIKIEITGEAATALAKLPELVRDIIADNARDVARRAELEEARLREVRLREDAEQHRLEKRAEEADERRQRQILSLVGVLAEAAKAYFAGKEDDDEPPEQESAPDAVLVHLRNELLLLAPRTKVGVLPLSGVLQILKHARPEWLPPENVGRILAIMQYCTDLRDAGDLLDALGEDTEAHREAVKVLDDAFDLYRKRADSGFMCMDCGAHQVDPKTHHKECKEHKDKLEPGPEDGPVSDVDFVIAVCSLVGLDATESLHLTDSLAMALRQISAWTDPLAWDHPDRGIDGPLRAIDRYLSNPAPKHIREVLDRKDLSTGMDWLKEAALRLRHLEGDNIDYVDADMRFISSVCRLAGLSGVAPDSLEGALRLLSTSIDPPTDPEPPTNVERVAEYLNARQYHPAITELLLCPDFKVAYERLKGIASSTLDAESA